MTGPSDEQLLQALRESAAQIAGLERQHDEIVAASRDSNADDEHDPEGATIAFEREQVSALLAPARQRRADLLHAVEQVRSGGYGRCELCGEPIGAERLARPAVGAHLLPLRLGPDLAPALTRTATSRTASAAPAR